MRTHKLKYVLVSSVVAVLCAAAVTAVIRIGRIESTSHQHPEGSSDALAERGKHLFQQNCSSCHFDDQRKTKVGPGLQGLFRRDKLPASGRPVKDETVRHQLQDPYKDMPSFADLNDESVRAIISYLKTL